MPSEDTIPHRTLQAPAIAWIATSSVSSGHVSLRAIMFRNYTFARLDAKTPSALCRTKQGRYGPMLVGVHEL